MSKWKVTLSDGTEYAGLELSGNTFYSERELSREMFTDGKLSKVKIECVEGSPEDLEQEALIGAHEHMKLLSCGRAEWRKCWMLVLGYYSKEELRELEVDGNLEYLAMMTGVEL